MLVDFFLCFFHLFYGILENTDSFFPQCNLFWQVHVIFRVVDFFCFFQDFIHFFLIFFNLLLCIFVAYGFMLACIRMNLLPVHADCSDFFHEAGGLSEQKQLCENFLNASLLFFRKLFIVLWSGCSIAVMYIVGMSV